MSAVIRTSIITLALTALALVTYWHLVFDEQAKMIADLQAINDQMQQRLQERQAMIERLSRTRRIAHVQITDQTRDIAGKVLHTTLQFIELDDHGSELARQSFTIPGDVMFIDAWTVKFDPEHVALGDPLRGRTLVLLRRIYSEQLAPQNGFVIDTPGAIPPGYAVGGVGEFEQRIWQNFWAIATDAKLANEMGVRVAQGEAVYKPVRTGQTYELVVDAVGGMSLMPLPQEQARGGAGAQKALSQAP